MSAQRLGRIAGLVLGLALFLGGTGSAAFGAVPAGADQAAQFSSLSIDWT
jgi:hypothetical protein